MVAMSTASELRKNFIEWNGWGPPASEYQIGEYCRSQTYSEMDSEFAFRVLMTWMNEQSTLIDIATV